VTPTNMEPSNPQPKNLNAARSKKRAYATHLRKTYDLANRVQVLADGTRRFVRFNQAEILEHWVLFIAFLILGTTGILGLTAWLMPVAWVINNIFGGITNIETIHKGAMIVVGILGLFHLLRILMVWFVERERGAMMPRTGDLSDLIKSFSYSIGMADERPKFDRFTIGEKLGYWWLLAWVVAMGFTGLILAYPTTAIQFMPAGFIPAARTIHNWSGLFAVGWLLTWHLYQALSGERNTSIFGGRLSEKVMRQRHPLEYERLITAYEETQSMRSSRLDITGTTDTTSTTATTDLKGN
jgi:formate dehydrogenase subunit gamma